MNIRIGTRASPLAITQANQVLQLIVNQIGAQGEIVPIISEGDRCVDRPLHEIGGKGLFIKALDQALLNHQVDCVVHCVKDMEPQLTLRTTIAAILQRVSALDVWVSFEGRKLHQLKEGEVIGTCSPRRKAQLKYYYPHLRTQDIRGNVQRRLTPREGLAGVILAAAGIERLNLTDCITEILSPEVMLPAVGQGALAIVVREDDRVLKKALLKLNHISSQLCIDAERSFVEALNATCHSPVAVWAVMDGEDIYLKGRLIHPEGEVLFHKGIKGRDPLEIGKTLAEELKYEVGLKRWQEWSER